MDASALIAEDEPLLAANLQAELARAWPGLRIVANVGHGAAAVEQALALAPDVVFLDIRMPGVSGLEAAQALAEDWPAGTALPLIVFVTAYDQYALQAFERAAVDYVLKPVQPERLLQTCTRLQSALRARREPVGGLNGLEATLTQLRGLLGATASGAAAAPLLSVIPASVGNATHLVPIGEVLYFEAADKYVRVITAAREYLIRASLRELLPQLDAQRFWQIHRGVVVRADAIESALRLETGKVELTLRDHPDKLIASRLYAHLFKAL
ncbi:MAG TPA: LytTR family DNA-binding domain-containing protein [Burkholderiaceae bacterium]